ncbi:hypothetical protein [Dyella sp. 2RAB6]|uniref:hypothetical protein n=1 Tax=Dyella sp. 2RAB6 TaxID=3232992 RepID=UPI003F8FC4F5
MGLCKFLGAISLVCFPPLALADYACTRDRWHPDPEVFDTGLGKDVDTLAYVSSMLYSDIRNLLRNRWTFHRDPARGYVERPEGKTPGKITIQDVAATETATSGLSHEIGHAFYKPRLNFSSRQKFIAERCLDEGHALVKNIAARDAIRACDGLRGGGVDVGLVAARPWEPYYELMTRSRPLDVGTLGMMFCESNIASGSGGQSYVQMLGAWYDEHHGQRGARATPRAGIGESFWQRVDQLARTLPLGFDELIAIWPSTGIAEDRAAASTSDGKVYRSTGSALFSGPMSVTASRLLVDEHRGVEGANLDLAGVCIRMRDLTDRYPDIVMTDAPTGHHMTGPASFSRYGLWGEITYTFYFEGPRKGCLGRISFDPSPTVAQPLPRFIDPPQLRWRW